MLNTACQNALQQERELLPMHHTFIASACTAQVDTTVEYTYGLHQLHVKICFVLSLHCCTPNQGVDLLRLNVIQAAYSLLDLFLVGSDVNYEDLHPDALTLKADLPFIM